MRSLSPRDESRLEQPNEGPKLLNGTSQFPDGELTASVPQFAAKHSDVKTNDKKKEDFSNNRRKMRRYRPIEEVHAEIKQVLRLDRDNHHGLVALGTDIGVIGAAALLAQFSPLFYPISVFVIGARQRALATLLHEAAHWTLFKSIGLNTVIGMLAGWSVFQTYHRYRQSHVDEHHRYLGDESRDPDTRNYADQGLFDEQPSSLILKHVVPLVLGLKSPKNVRNLIRDRLLPKDICGMTKREVLEYFGFLAFWATIVSFSITIPAIMPLLLLWLVSYLTAFQAVNWVIELAEHFPLISLFKTELEMTRNRRGGWLENQFFGIHGENWHLVHHLYPGIPFWQLKKTHEILMRDPAYAAANRKSGGLFVRGPDGEASIISLLGEQLAAAQAQSEHLNNSEQTS